MRGLPASLRGAAVTGAHPSVLHHRRCAAASAAPPAATICPPPQPPADWHAAAPLQTTAQPLTVPWSLRRPTRPKLSTKAHGKT